jgi:hypothetical protein
MSSAVEDILASARSLPPQEQLEVLRRLAESLVGIYSTLESAAAGFWFPRSLDELAEAQHVPIITDIRALALSDWLEDESADDIIGYTREQRHADHGE